MSKPNKLVFIAAVVLLPLSASSGFKQVPLVMHVQSTYSDDGVLSIDEIADIAARNGIKAVVVTDHDIMECEYGLPPLNKIIKKKIVRCSVLQAGPQKYLDAIAAANTKHPGVVLIPGVESTPFYYWTGSALKNGLTFNDWHKHMLVAGLYTAEQYRKLPVLGNERDAGKINYSFIWPLLAAITGIFIALSGPRAPGLVIFGAGVLFFLNSFPFFALPYDQYHGPQGEKPYQSLIDYVNNTAPETGMVFWAHPESPNFDSPQPVGPVLAKTGMYPESLYNTYNYTGFGYFQEGYRVAGKPGGVWDRVLTDFCKGKRNSPIWAVSELDYRKEGYLNTYIDSFKNILLMDEKDELNPKNIIRTLKAGRFYLGVKPRNTYELVLDRFEVRQGAVSASMGKNIILLGDDYNFEARFSASDGKRYPVNVRVIIDGKVFSESAADTPAGISIPGSALNGNGKSYCRIEINARNNSSIVSNPIFFERR